MNREEFEHAIRASCDLLGVRQVIIVGSQALLAQFPDAPRELRGSAEADVWTEELSEEQIEKLNSIGLGSLFHDRYGFYIDPVGPDTALLPSDWRTRSIRVDIADRGVSGISPEVHDLLISKLARGEEQDLSFGAGVIYHKMVRVGQVADLIAAMAIDADRKAHILTGLQAAEARARSRKRERREGR